MKAQAHKYANSSVKFSHTCRLFKIRTISPCIFYSSAALNVLICMHSDMLRQKTESLFALSIRLWIFDFKAFPYKIYDY